jgi:hypothetical protein
VATPEPERKTYDTTLPSKARQHYHRNCGLVKMFHGNMKWHSSLDGPLTLARKKVSLKILVCKESKCKRPLMINGFCKTHVLMFTAFMNFFGDLFIYASYFHISNYWCSTWILLSYFDMNNLHIWNSQNTLSWISNKNTTKLWLNDKQRPLPINLLTYQCSKYVFPQKWQMMSSNIRSMLTY